jgi:tRNA dimethylallyltransferase
MAEAPAPACPSRPTVVVLVGPTAVGKTAAAIELAQSVSGEIISADSRYLYRGLDIGTAKPTSAERARVPHHLIDVTTPDQPWTLAEYQRAAYAAIDGVLERRHLPLLVGGTGQYVRAVTEGWVVPPAGPAGPLRVELEQAFAERGVEALAERLRQVDPESAAQVDTRNPRRVIRALEVAITTGGSFVAQRQKSPPPFTAVWLGLCLPRAELYARVDARVEAMLAAGLVAEVEQLIRHGYGWELPAMSAVGYRQIGDYLRGACSLGDAVRAIKRATRQFVRRQANWFKPEDPAIRWFKSSPAAPPEMAAWLRGASPAGNLGQPLELLGH